MKNRRGISVCNNCHRPTLRAFATDGRQLWDILSCSPECDDDLSACLDGVPLEEVRKAGRAVDCSCIEWCTYCSDSSLEKHL